MSLPSVGTIIDAELTAVGFDLANAASQTHDNAETIVETFKSALIAWAPTAQLNTTFLHTPGPVIPIIAGPLTVTALAGLTAAITAALVHLYDPAHLDRFAGTVGAYLATPTGDGIGQTFTIWSASSVGPLALPLGVGTFVDPPVNSTVAVAFAPGNGLSATNFSPVVDAVVKALFISLLGPLVNANQSYLYAYYGAIAKAVKAIFDALPVSLLLTPLTPVSTGLAGSLGSVAWVLAVV